MLIIYSLVDCLYINFITSYIFLTKSIIKEAGKGKAKQIKFRVPFLEVDVLVISAIFITVINSYCILRSKQWLLSVAFKIVIASAFII